MSYVFQESNRGGDEGSALYTVGFFAPDGKWVADSDYENVGDASWRVHFLNGGSGQREFGYDLTSALSLFMVIPDFVDGGSECMALVYAGDDAGAIDAAAKSIASHATGFKRVVAHGSLGQTAWAVRRLTDFGKAAGVVDVSNLPLSFFTAERP